MTYALTRAFMYEYVLTSGSCEKSWDKGLELGPS